MRRRERNERSGRSAIFAVVMALSLAAAAAIPVASAAAPGGDAARSIDARAAELVQALRRRPSTLSRGRAAGAPVSVQALAVTGPGTISEADVVGDVDSRVDVSNVSATMTAGRIRLGVTLPSTPDPRSDPGWQVGLSFGTWQLDVDADTVADYTVAVLMDGSRSFGLVIAPDGSQAFCNSNASYARGARTFSAAIPLRCLGNPSHIDFQGGAAYDTDPFGSVPNQIQDSAPDTASLPIDVGPDAATTAAGYTVDGLGGIRSFAVGSGAPGARLNDKFGFDIVRGIAATPDGGHGYVVDGYGGLHGVEIGTNSFTMEAVGAPYWPGWDIARGVAVAAAGRGGYVLDAFGGLHPFAVNDARPMPAAVGGPYWSGWDVARGVAVLPNGRGGFVLDAFGGLNWFSLGRIRSKPAITGAPYWPGRDIARGVAILPDGTGGYVLDSAGALHAFGIGGPPPPRPSTAGLAPGRGLTVIPAPLPLPPPAPPLTPPVVP